MALPKTRPRTYVNGVPAIPDDLNETFDAIIDGKHDELETIHHATSFVTNPAALGVLDADCDAWIDTGGSGFGIISPLNYIPVGSRITRLKFYFDRQAGDIGLFLMRRPIDGDAAEIIDQLIYNAATGWQAIERAAINHVVEAGYAYRISLSVAAGANQARGASVFRDRL